ncbi:replication initiation protein a (plasmid) [Acinetobacter lwoffii]|uniref:replication initiation protein n=1 Tax=Acinetobacter lwoffii TaxID=28090 RepID=UPI00191CFFC5|nr:replication initiation protein [Acinetobacter lwoffii]QQA03245.1 replication initiation protein a [Acinetobacter lwoffii]
MQQLTIGLEQFTNRLPNKPYCSDDLYLGLQVRPKHLALLKRYIQPNHPYYTHFFVFDLDSPSAYVDYFYSMVGVPTPNLIIENPENGHAHFIYQLATPIYNTDASKPKPIQYANAVYMALRDALEADKSYSGLITKNAVHEHWRTNILREQPYTLDQLSERLDLTAKQINKEIKIDEAVGLGRNCCVFHKVRHWAYVEVRQYRSKSFNQWLDAVIAQCCSVNLQFTVPMQYNEVKGIAKSIARWVWKRDGYAYQEFIDRQKRKGQLGGLKGGVVRSAKYEDKRKQAIELSKKGLTQVQIATTLGVSTRTLRNWKSGK